MNTVEKRLSRLNGTLENDYRDYVDRLIRRRYSVSAELSVLRQRDVKPEEFAEYNAYAEECKARAKREFGISGGDTV